MTKLCRTCGVAQPIERFPIVRKRSGQTYRTSPCRDCTNEYHRRHYERNRGRIRERQRKYQAAHASEHGDRFLCWTYSITKERLAALREAHEGKCGLCGIAGKKLVMDHDHSSGDVRGLLCSSCNVGLGMFGDSAERLRTAIAYLEKYAATAAR